MCLIVVEQCKKAGISTEEGVSTDVGEALNPSEGGVSTPPRRETVEDASPMEGGRVKH